MMFFRAILFCIVFTLCFSLNTFHELDNSYVKMAVNNVTMKYSDPTPLAIKNIVNFEKFSHRPYFDVNGYAIGYGTHSKHFVRKGFITEKEAKRLVVVRLNIIKKSFDKNIPWWRNLSTNRQSALMDLAYNVGISGLYKFKNALTCLAKNDYDNAALELLFKSAKSKKRKTPYYRVTGRRALHVASLITDKNIQLLASI